MALIDIKDSDVNNIEAQIYGKTPVYSSEYKVLFLPGTTVNPLENCLLNDLLQDLKFITRYLKIDNKHEILNYPILKYSLFFGAKYAYTKQFIGFSLGTLRAILIGLIAYKISKEPKNIILLDGPDVREFLLSFVGAKFIYNKEHLTITLEDVLNFLDSSRIMKLSLYSNVINSINPESNLFKLLYIKNKSTSKIESFTNKTKPILLSHNAIIILNTLLNRSLENKTLLDGNKPVFVEIDLFEKIYDIIDKNENIVKIIINVNPNIIKKIPNHITNIDYKKMYYLLIYNNELYCFEKKDLKKYSKNLDTLNILR